MTSAKKSLLALATSLLVTQMALAAAPTYQYRMPVEGLRASVGTTSPAPGTTTPATPSSPSTPGTTTPGTTTPPPVVSKPVIQSMAYEVAYVSNRPGNYNYLTWATSGADSATVVCSGLATGQESGTSGEMWPDVVGNRTNGVGTCTLTATNAAGSTVRSEDFTAVAPAQITAAFDSTTMPKGQSNIIRWSTKGAVIVTVDCITSSDGVNTRVYSDDFAGQLSVVSGDYGGGCTVRGYDQSGHYEQKYVSFALPK